MNEVLTLQVQTVKSPIIKINSILLQHLKINLMCMTQKNLSMKQKWASQVATVVRNPSANAGDVRDKGLIPGSGRSLEGGHGNALPFLTWRIPWTEEPGELQSLGSQRAQNN